jgi:hypothetical protein
MENCSNCKYGKTVFEKMNSIEGMTFLNSNPESVLGDMYGKCIKGNQDVFVDWWKSNANKKTSESNQVTCYEPTQINVMLDNIIDKVNEMNDLVSELIKKV